MSEVTPHPNLVQNYARFPLRFVRGAGCWLYDEDGRAYLDCLSGIAVNALGHGHPHLTAAIREQAGQLLHTSNLFGIAPQERLAERLCAASFADRVYFCNSGAEANETAFKIARLWGNQVHGGSKPRIVAAEASFHGRTVGALAMTGTAAYREPFAPLPAVDFVPYGDVGALEQAMRPDVSALVLEPLQGEGGVRVPPAGYLQQARALCDQHQALLIFDEVQTGIGRTGDLFAYQHEGVVPDVMSLAKGLGGGVPIGASLMREELAQLLTPGTHASTFGGNHLACAAGNAVLDVVQGDGFLPGVRTAGARIAAELQRLLGDAAVEVRGRGLLIGAQLRSAPLPLLRACLDQGLICGVAGSNVLRLAPPLIIGEAEIDALVERLAAAWTACPIA
ncbi:MAG: acetylornithine transaminase [Planctomycetota bacterium]